MRRKISILTAMFLAATTAAFVVAPSTAEQRMQVNGTPYVLPTGFVVELDSGASHCSRSPSCSPPRVSASG